MYLNFYQLNKKPFSLAPDPEFLYLSQQHKDALGAIIYGIKEREGTPDLTIRWDIDPAGNLIGDGFRCCPVH